MIQNTKAAFAMLLILLSTQVALAELPFKKVLEENADKGSPESVLLTVVSDFLTDDEAKDKKLKKTFEIVGRENEADQILDTLARMKGAVPILIGAAGVGKTTTIQRAAQKVINNEYPQSPAFDDVLKNSAWVSMTAGRIMRLVKINNSAGRMAAIEDLFDAVLELEQKYSRRIILFIDEIHSLDKDQIEAMLPYLDSTRRMIRLVGSTNSDKYQNAFKDNDAWQRRSMLIGIEELDAKTTLDVIRQTWQKKIQAKYGVLFSRDALEAAVRVAPILLPEAGRFDATIKTMQDVAIARLRHPIQALDVPVSAKEIYKFFTTRTGYPVNPYDGAAMIQFVADLRESILSQIIDQPRMVNDVTWLVQSVLSGSKKGLGVAMLVGPTGTGKSELGLQLAKLVYKNPGAFLRIDANEYKNGSYSLNKLFGAEGGLVTSDERSGVLSEYFDDPSRGKFGGVILIDEAERAHPEFWERMMEFLDTGSFVGGDGRRRNARNHIVIITSNRGDQILFPDKAATWSEGQMKAHVEGLTADSIKGLFTRRVSGSDEFNLPVPVLNRIDVFSVAQPLTAATARKIVAKVAAEFSADTQEQFKIDIEIDSRLVDYLTDLDYSLKHGARPIIRRATQVLQDARAQALAKLKLEATSKLFFEYLEDANKIGQLNIRLAEKEESLTLPLPRRKIDDPLRDPETREKLRSLEAKLNARVIGQSEAIKSVSRSVVGHVGSPMAKRPLSLFVVGLTGTGKTELGRALAESLYGSSDRAEVIPLGQITHESQFNKIFGSDPGFIGSDRERSFEEALRNNPDGGVIIFDEASNMGGTNTALKDTFFKKFYDIIEEGVWTSSATGTTYELRKYIFLLTGNDGDKIFKGILADDLRLKAWENAKDKPSVRKLLVEAGVPSPFIGRMADVILYKPLLRSEIREIVRQRIDLVAKVFEKREVVIRYNEEFLDHFGNAFFSPDTGARSLRSVAEDRVRGFLTQALIEAELDLDATKKPVIELSVQDNSSPRSFTLAKDPTRAVLIHATVTKPDGTVTKLSEDLTEYSPGLKKLPVDQAVKTAFHEAGHAVTNDEKLSGMRLRHLTILGDEGSLGYASYDRLPGKALVSDRKATIFTMAKLLGGQIAMMMAGFPGDSGWSNDLEKARSIATRYLRDWGMTPEFQAIALDQQGNPEPTPSQKDALAREIEKMMQEAIKIAQTRLAERWTLVHRVVIKLMKAGSITGNEYDELIKAFAEHKEAWTLKTSRPKQNVCELLLTK